MLVGAADRRSLIVLVSSRMTVERNEMEHSARAFFFLSFSASIWRTN